MNAGQELRDARAELAEVRSELSQRPTKKQIGWVIFLIIIGGMAIGVVGFVSLFSAFSSSDILEVSQEDRMLAQVEVCRESVRSASVDKAQVLFNEAFVAREIARDARDNLTSEALQARTEGDEVKLAELIGQAQAKRDEVVAANNLVSERGGEFRDALDGYQQAMALSLSDPNGFLGSYCPS